MTLYKIICIKLDSDGGDSRSDVWLNLLCASTEAVRVYMVAEGTYKEKELDEKL